jgi:hypothetical protein
LKAKTIQLYSNILKYQIQLAIYYRGSWLRRSLGDFVVSNDRKGMKERLEGESKGIEQDLSEDDRNMITVEFANINENAEKSLDILKGITDDLKARNPF